RFDGSVVENVVEVDFLEVGNADRAELAGLVRLFQRAPGFQIALKEMLALTEVRPRLRAMDNHEIEVIQPGILQRAVNASLRFGIGLVGRLKLGGHKKLVAGNATGADAFTDAAFVAVAFGRVEMAIADRRRIANDL